jgi:hypothetical protein
MEGGDRRRLHREGLHSVRASVYACMPHTAPASPGQLRNGIRWTRPAVTKYAEDIGSKAAAKLLEQYARPQQHSR